MTKIRSTSSKTDALDKYNVLLKDVLAEQNHQQRGYRGGQLNGNHWRGSQEKKMEFHETHYEERT